MDDGRAGRAAARRASPWQARIVRAGTPKPLLYADLTREERLEAYWRLIRRAWVASGRQLPTAGPRNMLPGEIFKITRHG